MNKKMPLDAWTSEVSKRSFIPRTMYGIPAESSALSIGLALFRTLRNSTAKSDQLRPLSGSSGLSRKATPPNDFILLAIQAASSIGLLKERESMLPLSND